MRGWVQVLCSPKKHYIEGLQSLCGELKLQAPVSTAAGESDRCTECVRIREIPGEFRMICEVCEKVHHVQDLRPGYTVRVCAACEDGYKRNDFCL